MIDFKVAAQVLIGANDGPVDLSRHCDIYSDAGQCLAAFLQKHATVKNTSLGSFASSKAGAFIASPMGARVQSVHITVEHSPQTRALAKGTDPAELASAFLASALEAVEGFECLWQEAAAIDCTWQIHERVFGAEDNIRLLNDTDSAFFFFCERCMRREVVMGLCRLTDPEEQGRNENMTTERLLRLITAAGLPGGKELAGCGDCLRGDGGGNSPLSRLRKARNKRGGHLDLKTARAQLTAADPLEGYSPGDVRDVLKAITGFVNKAGEILHHRARSLGSGGGDPNAGEVLLNALRTQSRGRTT
jgi:hypothetical protein